MKLAVENLSSIPHVAHGFFTREGGVSGGVFASLNCGYGSGDDPRYVAKNRAIVETALGVKHDHLITCYQIHSAHVAEVTAAWDMQHAPEADAMVTATPGIALGILTADCVPVLFADTAAKVIGAAHAGWKGATLGVLEATIEKMCAHGAVRKNIVAAIGPCIRQKSYEVGPEFFARFLQENESNAAFFVPSEERDGHFRFDLPGYAALRLKKAGISGTNSLANDTCFEEDAFFSYRRATLRGEASYGRLVSAIALK